MKFVPKAERRAWHEKAIEAAKGADLHSLIELLLETKEMERLADLVRQSKDQALESLSHYTTEPAAKKLEKTHPDLAARLWRAQGMRDRQRQEEQVLRRRALELRERQALLRAGGARPPSGRRP